MPKSKTYTLRRLRRAASAMLVLACVCALLVSGMLPRAYADTVFFNLASGDLRQDWSNTELITTNDNWNGVPSIVGYIGNFGAQPEDVDPRTITDSLNNGSQIDVVANSVLSPNLYNTGGVVEFAPSAVGGNPTIALNGSATADYPNLSIYLNTTGRTRVTLSYNIRDLDASADDGVKQVATQYRLPNPEIANPQDDSVSRFVNIDGGYTADATDPNLATRVTAVSVTLPAAALNQPRVEVRIITNNNPGTDEVIGIDDIVVTSTGSTTPTNNPPVANDQNETIEFNTARTFTLNVSDPDANDTLTFAVTVAPTKGTVTFDVANRRATYTPNAGATGADSFTYSVTDSAGATDTATVNININAAPNAAPVANDQTEAIAFNTARTFALNVSDPNANDTLTFAIVTPPTKGTVSFNAANRTATYTPNAGATGVDSFVYRVTDAQGASDTAIVTLNIGAPPQTGPTEVTASVRFESSGLVVRRGPGRITGDYYGTITINNVTSSNISAPIQLVLDNLTPGIVLVNATGTTQGDPFITINQSLAAGGIIVIPVQFRNPQNLGINYTPRLFSGSFSANQVQQQTVSLKYRKVGRTQ